MGFGFCSLQVAKAYKYPVEEAPAYAKAVMEGFEPGNEEQGVFSEQAKPRGRKPKKPQPDPKPARKAAAKKTAKGKGCKGRSKANRQDIEDNEDNSHCEDGDENEDHSCKQDSDVSAPDQPEAEVCERAKHPAGTKKKRKVDETAGCNDQAASPSQLSESLAKLIEDPTLPLPPLEDLHGHYHPPEWATTNNVYSAVYKQYLKDLSGTKSDVEAARKRSKLATRIMREYKVVIPDLMGSHSFCPKMRGKKLRAKPDEEQAGGQQSTA